MAKKLSQMEQKASSKVLDALRGETQSMLKGKMDGLKKVSVASDSSEGLEKGLDLAKRIAGHANEPHKDQCSICGGENHSAEDHESNADESEESPEEERNEVLSGEEKDISDVLPQHHEMDAEQLDKHIAKLHALRFKKK